MKKWLLFGMVLLFGFSANAQKHDAVWVFGYRAGIDFSDPQNPVPFESSAENFEVNASFSDSLGSLLFYLSAEGVNTTFEAPQLMDNTGQVISGGDSIATYSSCQNCAIVLPSSQKDRFTIFHIASSTFCFAGACNRLLVSEVLHFPAQDSLLVETVNHNLYLGLPFSLSEKLSAVRHANGEDWWVLSHKSIDDLNSPPPNEFVKFLVTKDTILGPYIQSTGNIQASFFVGEMVFSPSGNKIVSGIPHSGHTGGTVEVFGFNRCDGTISFLDSLALSNEAIYGAVFSPNNQLLYITTQSVDTPTPGYNTIKLYQIDLSKQPLSSGLIELWSFAKENALPGQLELAPNNKIYMSYYAYSDSLPFGWGAYYGDSTNTHLGVIHQPDSVGQACDFRPFDFYLGDSAMGFFGLPNYPNYRLGPLSIYTTSAGADTTFCIEDTTLPATLTLGQPDTSNLQYTWWPQDSFANPNLAQQTITLPKGVDTLQYILTIGDSTITNACTTRDDTVTIVLKSCEDDTVGVPGPATANFKLFPNPNSGSFIVQHAYGGTVNLSLFNLHGQQLYSRALPQGSSTIQLPHQVSNGLYFARFQYQGQFIYHKKLMVVR